MPPSKKAARGTARAPRSTTNQTGLLQGEEQALPAEEMTLFDYGAWNYEVRASLFLLRAAPGAEQPLFHVTASYDGCWGSRLTVDCFQGPEGSRSPDQEMDMSCWWIY